jgi:hypothetical protein
MTMTANIPHETKSRYARAIAASRRARWDIDADVIKSRLFGSSEKFLPDRLSLVDELPFLTGPERIFMSQVQGRTYANVFGLVERYINDKVLEISRHYSFSDQVALEALVRFSDEEIKHQELFRRIERLAGAAMPEGYVFLPQPNEVAGVVLQKSTWAVLALTCLIELFTQVHYKTSIETDDKMSPLFKDVFRFHWMEESQHAVLDELEWRAEDARISAADRDQAVKDLIELVAAVDGILVVQSEADAVYFTAHAGRSFSDEETRMVRATLLRAYRHQYILSGVRETRFTEILASLASEEQIARITGALATIA